MKSLTKKENEAEWIKNQRKQMEKTISEVVKIILNENLKPHYRPKYKMEFSIGMSGNCADLRVYNENNTGDSSLVFNIDVFGIAWFLESCDMYFDKKEAEKHSIRIIRDLQIMRLECLKYSKLNETK